MASRTELKATFSGGNRINESDFALLIDSLAHVSEDSLSGVMVAPSEITAIQSTISQLEVLAQSAKNSADSVAGIMPTLESIQVADNQTRIDTLASVKVDTDALEAVNTAQQTKIDTLESTLNTLNLDFTQDINSLVANQVSVDSKADITYVDGIKASLESDIAGKALLSHTHSEYALKTDISASNYITLADVPASASPLHTHLPSDIVGLNDLFTTPSQVDQKILDASKTLDEIDQLYDLFYDKAEVDHKFYVARWRTDQISLFNPSVVSIAQPLVDLAQQEIELSIAQVRVSILETKTSVLNTVAQTRAEIEASINTTNTTVESNRVSALAERGVLQTNIDTVQANATASIASSEASVLGQLSTVRAEVLAETSANNALILSTGNRATSLEARATSLEAKDASLDSDISGLQGQIATTNSSVTQSLVDAKAYTDSEISELLGGAGPAYDTLKELQDHLEANDSSAAQALTTQVSNLQTQIDSNDTDITAVEGRATSIESSIQALEAQDGLFLADFNTFGNYITSNDTELEALQTFVHGTSGFVAPSSPFPSSSGIIPRLDALAAQDVTFQNNQNSFNLALSNFQTTYDNLIQSNANLLLAYNDLTARLTTLENSAYAEAGYTFP